MHNTSCQIVHPSCLCLSCKHDNPECCFTRFPDEDCFITACDNYEKEDE